MRHTVIWTLLLIGFVVFARLVPHPANFSPIAALLVFIPIFFPKQRLLPFIPLVGMALSDVFLGSHGTWMYVYGSYIAIWITGKLYTHSFGEKSLLLFPIFSSLLFFLVTNFGVWQTTAMYSKDTTGLLEAYLMGIPFLKATFAGDLFYTALFSVILAISRSKLSIQSRQSFLRMVSS